jgi:hypothetical protein
LLTLELLAAASGKTGVSISNVAARNAKLEAIKLDGVQAEVVIQ